MKTSILSITVPILGQNILSAEDFIAYVARVSNPTNQLNTETARKLLKYLIKNKHWSPFELAHMTVSIETSRAIAAQILRHRSFSFQEFSQRYSTVNGYEVYRPRSQDIKNRQNSIDDMSGEVINWFQQAQITINTWADKMYQQALDKGIAKEQARFLLPLSSRTTLYMSGNVRSWIHYIQLRTDPSTQLEHREIAESIKVIFSNNFPNIAEALEWK